jgi:glutaminase
MDQTEPSIATNEHAIESCIKSIYIDCLPNRKGNVADYIPELAGVDPDPFGIAVATVGGQLWNARTWAPNFSAC